MNHNVNIWSLLENSRLDVWRQKRDDVGGQHYMCSGWWSVCVGGSGGSTGWQQHTWVGSLHAVVCLSGSVCGPWGEK